MFCPKCGTFNKDENFWCIKCGYKLDEKQSPSEGDNACENEAQQSDCLGKAEERTETNKMKKPEKIKDYLAWSIVAAIFGSISFGTVALIFAGLTNSELSSGNKLKAKNHSAMARTFCLISLAIGIVKVLFIAFMFAFIFITSVLPYYFY